ncbi:MAG: hypothetical protein ACM359_03740 [Bacillota bacterium]
MWDFFRPVLQTVSGAICLAVIWWVQAYAKSQYKAKKPLIDRILRFVVVDALTALGIVVTGLQVAKLARSGSTGHLVAQWFTLGMLTLLRLYTVHLHSVALRVARLMQSKKRAAEEPQEDTQEEMQALSPADKALLVWMEKKDDCIVELYRPLLNPLILYEIVSTAAWFWLAMYIVIFWR